MTKKWMLLLTSGIIVGAGSAALAQTIDLRPAVVTNLTGTLHIAQGIPCGTASQTTTVAGGVLKLSPAQGISAIGGTQFMLTTADVSFAPFSISGSCYGYSDTRNYTSVSAHLTRDVTFTAPSPAPGVYTVTIPKENFSIYETAIVNGSPEVGYKTPSEDVTGTLNFTTRTASFHIVLGTRVHFEGGCVLGSCIIDETDSGTLTTDVSGTLLLPDTDADGVPDVTDNCPFVANPDQTPVPTPTIAAPADVTLASCADRQFGGPKAADVCDGGPVTVTDNAPATFLVGPNTVTWTATDSKARTATDTQIVTVVDTTPPIFTYVPPDVQVYDCGPVNLGQPTATDDCAGTPVITNNAPAYFYVGLTPVTWTARDASGNTTTAGQTVKVTDTVPPTVSCVATQPTGNSFKVTASDACSSPTIRLGTFVIANGETIMINETGQPGVRLINVVGAARIRHFQVGKGQAVITATDPSANMSTATCSK